MDNIIQNTLGNDGIAQLIGAASGNIVENMIKKGDLNPANLLSLAGGGEEKKEGILNPANLLSLAGGGEEKKEGILNPANLLSLAGGGGKDEGEGGGIDVKGIVGGLFQ